MIFSKCQILKLSLTLILQYSKEILAGPSSVGIKTNNSCFKSQFINLSPTVRITLSQCYQGVGKSHLSQNMASTHVYSALLQLLHFLCHSARAMVDAQPAIALETHPAERRGQQVKVWVDITATNTAEHFSFHNLHVQKP